MRLLFICLMMWISTSMTHSQSVDYLCDQFLRPPQFLQMSEEVLPSGELICDHPFLVIIPVHSLTEEQTGWQMGICASLGSITAYYRSRNTWYASQSCCASTCSYQMGTQNAQEVIETFYWPQIFCTGPLYARITQGVAYGLSCLGVGCVKLPESGCIVLCCGHEI